MAKRMSVTVTGTAASAAIPLDDNSSSPHNVSLWVQVGSGDTYTIQCTPDNVQATGYDPDTGLWIDHSDATGLTVNCAVGLAFPATAVRLKQTAGSSDSVFTVIQQGV